jgi:hypothetical protein
MTNSVDNGARRQLMGYRGYETREALFAGFPRDVTWRRVELDTSDFETMRYINDANAGSRSVNLSNGTRLVSVGAANLRLQLPDPDTQHITAIAQALRNGLGFPPLIAAQHARTLWCLLKGTPEQQRT